MSRLNRYAKLQSKTPLKPGKPLRRNTDMPRGEGLKRTSWLGSGGKALERAATTKPKRRKYTGPPKSTKELLAERSGGMCEIGLLCLGNAPAVDPSHRIAKGTGGTDDPGSGSAANNVASCRDDHEAVEADPLTAYNLGLKIRHGVARPHEVPAYLHTHNGWVLLDDQGGHRSAPVASYGTPLGLIPVITITFDGSDVEDGAVFEAVYRWGHLDCGGWTYETGGLCTCDCGTVLFVVEATQ